MANRAQLAEALHALIGSLEEIRRAVESADSPALEKLFATAKQRRDAWCASSASPSPE